MINFTIESKRKKEIIDITDKAQKYVTDGKIESGLCSLFLLHTTAALTTADLDPGGTDQDYLDVFANLMPKFAPTGVEGINYRHPHNPAHVPDHILSSMIGASLLLPFENKKLILGTWQRVILVELDGPRKREVVLSIL